MLTIKKAKEIIESSPDVYGAPASLRFHNAYGGGLIDHLRNVWKFARQLGLKAKLPADKQEQLEALAMLHDIGKYLEYVNTKDGWKKSNKGHHIDLFFTLVNGLEEEEVWAIYRHHGPWTAANHAAKSKDTLLGQLLHQADMLAVELEENQACVKAAKEWVGHFCGFVYHGGSLPGTYRVAKVLEVGYLTYDAFGTKKQGWVMKALANGVAKTYHIKLIGKTVEIF